MTVNEIEIKNDLHENRWNELISYCETTLSNNIRKHHKSYVSCQCEYLEIFKKLFCIFSELISGSDNCMCDIDYWVEMHNITGRFYKSLNSETELADYINRSGNAAAARLFADFSDKVCAKGYGIFICSLYVDIKNYLFDVHHVYIGISGTTDFEHTHDK